MQVRLVGADFPRSLKQLMDNFTHLFIKNLFIFLLSMPCNIEWYLHYVIICGCLCRSCDQCVVGD